MTQPVSRDQLHEHLRNKRREGKGPVNLESELDAVLSQEGSRGQRSASGDPDAPVQSPLDRMRDFVASRLIPIVVDVADRYRDKGVELAIDPRDILSGGRGLALEIRYGTHLLRLEGTVVDESIAFNEMIYVNDIAGTMGTGPMLRARHLTPDAFAEFLYQRILGLVRMVKESRRHTV